MGEVGLAKTINVHFISLQLPFLSLAQDDTCSMTWEDALRNTDVVTIEDPLHSAALSKAAYNDAYGEDP
jgi:hypothetical protein